MAACRAAARGVLAGRRAPAGQRRALATVEIAVDDVLVDQDVNVLTSPVCSEADGEFTCAGTTLDNKPITVTVPDDQTQVMTIKIDGTQIFSGPVQEVIEKAGERTS